jgi:DNA (cytosine-5)-methyltransferase 1
MTATVDLFAGPGGWDLGARLAGLPDPLGIEWGTEECQTRRAAGLPTVEADVALLDPLDYAGATGLIASPPCQAWSMAGKGRGRTDDIAKCEAAAAAIVDEETGQHLDADGLTHRDLLATYAAECADPRSILVVEPLRWAVALNPRWMAWEQVPPVLGFWETCADHLRGLGYNVWTGIVSAEQYGVPQTRKRAILLAARDGRPVGRPAPTHRRYVSPTKLPADGLSLFAADDLAERRVHAEDHGLEPWVSMAEALGWADDALVGFPRRADTASNKAAGVVTIDGEDYRERDLRTADLPAQVVTEKSRSWTVRANGQARDSGPGAERAPRPVDAPSFTIRSAGSGSAPAGVRWVDDRTSTTVACDPRIARPGHHGTGEDGDAGRSMTDAVRVTVTQAAVLQSFPADHPWQGSRTAQYRQIGNAVPPVLAQHVLGSIAAPEIMAARRAVAA